MDFYQRPTAFYERKKKQSSEKRRRSYGFWYTFPEGFEVRQKKKKNVIVHSMTCSGGGGWGAIDSPSATARFPISPEEWKRESSFFISFFLGKRASKGFPFPFPPHSPLIPRRESPVVAPEKGRKAFLKEKDGKRWCMSVQRGEAGAVKVSSVTLKMRF